MGSVFIQTTLFGVFTLNYSLRLGNLPMAIIHNYQIDLDSMPISQTFEMNNYL